MSRYSKSRLKVALGIIIDPIENKVLVALRPSHHPYGGLWEFPGGKFEGHETPLQALKRELFEEIGIELVKAEPLINFEYDYPSAIIELNAFKIIQYRGTPFGREGQKIEWVNIAHLSSLKFLEGNRIIIEKLYSLISS